MYTCNHIKIQLNKALSCSYINIQDDSHLHANHYEGGALSHLSITIVSADFDGLNSLKRQRMVNKAMQPFFDQGLHALVLKCFSPSEWALKQG